MTTKAAGEFETGLARLEAIVKQLETDEVSLDDAVALFREGKLLSRRCETLLAEAQEAIETADADPSAANAPKRQTGVPGRPAATSTLFDDTVLEDDMPF